MLTLPSYNYHFGWWVWKGGGGLIVPSLMRDLPTDILSTRIMTTRPNNNYRPPPPIPTQIPCVSIPQIIVVPSLMRHKMVGSWLHDLDTKTPNPKGTGVQELTKGTTWFKIITLSQNITY